MQLLPHTATQLCLPLVPKGTEPTCGEVRAQLYVALDQGYLTDQDFEGLVGQAERTSQLIAGLIRYLQRKTPNAKRPA